MKITKKNSDKVKTGDVLYFYEYGKMTDPNFKIESLIVKYGPERACDGEKILWIIFSSGYKLIDTKSYSIFTSKEEAIESALLQLNSRINKHNEKINRLTTVYNKLANN